MNREELIDRRDALFDIKRELARIKEELEGLMCREQGEYIGYCISDIDVRLETIDSEIKKREEEFGE